jgi:hypothetical protein
VTDPSLEEIWGCLHGDLHHDHGKPARTYAPGLSKMDLGSRTSRKHDFIPPLAVRSCKAIVSAHPDDLELQTKAVDQ